MAFRALFSILALALSLSLLTSVGNAALKCESLFSTKNPLLQEKDQAIKLVDLKKFVLTQKIISAQKFNQLEEKISLFNVNNKDMGNALFYAVLDEVGSKPSAKLDLLNQEYLHPIFSKYLEEFRGFLQTQNDSNPTEVKALFGLAEYGFSDSNTFFWTSAHADRFMRIAESVFNKKENFDLRQANQILVQLTYIHTLLSRDKKMSAAEIDHASEIFLASIQMGHTFIPAVGMWDITNINAQWFLNTTVNMLPNNLNLKVDVHGGLSSLDGISHDHGHYYDIRLQAAARILDVPLTLRNKLKLDRFNARLHDVLLETLRYIQSDSKSRPAGNLISGTIFFFIHQPETLEFLAQKIRQGELDWHIQSENTVAMARYMREQLEIHQDFFPNLGKDFDSFEHGARYWLSIFATKAVESGLVKEQP